MKKKHDKSKPKKQNSRRKESDIKPKEQMCGEACSRKNEEPEETEKFEDLFVDPGLDDDEEMEPADAEGDEDVRRRAEEFRERRNPLKIKAYLDRTVCGQEEAKISLSMALYNHMLSMERGKKLTNETTLLIGPTGCGKTMLAKAIAQYAGIPLVVVDASQITQDGFKGMNKDAIIGELMTQGPEEMTEWGIIVLDEFDKLVRPSYDGSGENVAMSIQGSLLGMLDGTPVHIGSSACGTMFKTENLLFILTGSFSYVEENLKEKKKNEFGFRTGPESGAAETVYSHEKVRTLLEESGVMAEIVGRIANIAFVNALSADELYDAVMEKEDALMKRYSEALEENGKKLVLDESVIREMARESAESGLGVRGLRNMISERLRESVFESYTRDECEVRLENCRRAG